MSMSTKIIWQSSRVEFWNWALAYYVRSSPYVPSFRQMSKRLLKIPKRLYIAHKNELILEMISTIWRNATKNYVSSEKWGELLHQLFNLFIIWEYCWVLLPLQEQNQSKQKAEEGGKYSNHHYCEFCSSWSPRAQFIWHPHAVILGTLNFITIIIGRIGNFLLRGRKHLSI